MAKKSKRYTEAAALIENGKLYSAEEAIELVKKTSNVRCKCRCCFQFRIRC